jgi:uncharacterized protein (TIGR03435 family)
MRATSGRMVLFLSATALFAQTSTTRLVYEAATVKLNTSNESGSHIDGTKGQIILKNMPLERLTELAFSVGPHRVVGPDWMNSVRVDIAAKYPPDTNRPDRWLMLRSLLEDSFKLAVHRESKEVQGYALVVAKGGFKLKPVEGGGNDTQSSGGRVPTLSAKSTSIAFLADFIARYVDGPVVDKSGVDGVFDFDLRWLNGDPNAEHADEVPQLPLALQETLGLRLQAQKVPVDVVVVDHLERAPIEN